MSERTRKTTDYETLFKENQLKGVLNNDLVEDDLRFFVSQAIADIETRKENNFVKSTFRAEIRGLEAVINFLDARRKLVKENLYTIISNIKKQVPQSYVNIIKNRETNTIYVIVFGFVGKYEDLSTRVFDAIKDVIGQGIFTLNGALSTESNTDYNFILAAKNDHITKNFYEDEWIEVCKIRKNSTI